MASILDRIREEAKREEEKKERDALLNNKKNTNTTKPAAETKKSLTSMIFEEAEKERVDAGRASTISPIVKARATVNSLKNNQPLSMMSKNATEKDDIWDGDAAAANLKALREQLDDAKRDKNTAFFTGKDFAGKKERYEELETQVRSLEDEIAKHSAPDATEDDGWLKQIGNQLYEDYLEGMTVLPQSWEQFGKELGYNAERVAAGLLGAGESVVDFFGAGIYNGLEDLTSVNGLLPNAVSDWMGRGADAFLDNSITKRYEDNIRERYNPSKQQENWSGIAQNVGQVLADIGTGKVLAGAAVKGAGLIDDAAEAARAANWSKGVFGTRAAGASAQEAKGEGATTGQALTYGAASGMMEVLVESLSGGIPGMGDGKVSDKVIDVVKKVVDNPVVDQVLQIVGEGGEEAASAIISPFLKRAIYDKNAALATPAEIAESALLGMVTSGILQGGISLPNYASARSEYNNSATQMDSESVQAIIEEGLATDPNSKSYKQAVALKAKLDAGETITNKDLDNLYRQNVKNVDMKSDPDAILAEAAAEAVARENGAEMAQDDVGAKNAPIVTESAKNAPTTAWVANEQVSEASVPYNVLNADHAIRQDMAAARNQSVSNALKNANYGKNGTDTFTSIVQSTNADPASVMKRFDAPYQAGLTGLPMNQANLVNDFQVEAYNAGRMDLIANEAADAKHTPGVILAEDASDFDTTNAPKDVTQAQKDFANWFAKSMGVQGGFNTGEGLAYNAFYDPKTGGVDFAQDFGIGPKLMQKLGSMDFQQKVEKLADQRSHSFVFYVGHEIAGHVTMDRAPKQMRAFVNAMYNYKQGKAKENLARDKQTVYGIGNVKLDTAAAIEEVTSDSILDLYETEQDFMDAMYRVFNGVNEDAKVGARKYLEILKDTIAKLKAWVGRMTGNTSAVEQGISELEHLRKMFENAVAASMKQVKEARENGQAVSKRDGKLFRTTETDGTNVLTTANGNPVAMMDENGGAVFSLKTYDAFGRAELKRWLDQRVSKNQIDKADAEDIVRQLDEYYDLCQNFLNKYAPFGAWSNAEVVRDNQGKPVFSVVKANGEYAMNLDFSLVCKKRRTLDAVFGEMIKRGMMDNVDLAESDIAKINDVIRESGFETACALCFVDAKRYRQAKVADAFVNQYNELVMKLMPEGGDVKAHHFDFVETGNYKNDGKGLHTLTNAELKEGIDKLKQVMRENGSKTVPYKIAKHLMENPQDRKLVNRGEFMNTDGFGAVRLKNPRVLSLYNSSKGSGGPKAAFADVQYLGEILKKNNFTPGRAYAVGGVRIQSFSDYIPRLVFDYLQMVGDLAAKQLPAHAYTKEATFVKQFGMTGIKMNMSLVPAVAHDGVAVGLDKNGNYYWFDGQSFGSDVGVKGSGQTGFELAIQIQNAPGYSEHCGTIAVGVSDAHIWKMLDDDNIRMIIPYHKSSLNHIVAVMNNIDKYTDYTGVQNTRYKDSGKKIDKKDFNFNEALRRTGDAKTAANEYLAWCEKNGYLPKFDTFAGHENYYKMLEDFSTYDNGVAAPQGPVTMTFPKEGDVFGSMAELIEQGLDEDAVLEGRRDKNLSSIVDKVDGVLKKLDDGKKYSARDIDNDGYSNSGVNWAYENDAIERKDLARFWETIANLNKRGYYIPRSKNGQYIVESDNTLMLTNGDYKAPTISTVIRLNDKSETNMALAKELIFDEERQYGSHNVSKRVIEDVYGEGYVSEFHRGDYRTDAWENERGEGAYRKGRTGETVNGKKLSLKDSSGKELTKAQAEFFKRSKVRDKNGNLLVVYHGGMVENDFDTERGGDGSTQYGKGAYFTASEYYASEYSDMKGGQVRPYYLNIAKMFDDSSYNGGEIADSPEWDNLVSILKDKGFNERQIKGIKEWGFDRLKNLLAQKAGVTGGFFGASQLANDVLRQAGYEGIRADYYDSFQYVIFSPEQAKSVDNLNPTNFYDVNFSLKGEDEIRAEIKRIRTEGKSNGKSDAEIDQQIMDVVSTQYGELIKAYGEIQRGEKPTRDINVPSRTGKNRHVSQTIRTVLEAGATPDVAVPTIQELITQGDFSYERITDKAAMAEADNKIKYKGYETAMADWLAEVKKGVVSKANTAMGWSLYNAAANNGDLKTAMTILNGMVQHQRSAAQALQATRILKKMAPDAQLFGIQRSVESLKDELIERYGEDAPDLKINEGLARKFLEATTDEDRSAAEREIYHDIGKQMPSTFMDKWNAWRYLAMLGNPRTHVRNIVGNAGFMIPVVTKNILATGIESAVSFVTKGKVERSKAMPSRALLVAAWNDYANVADEISAGGKYNDAAVKNQHIEEGRVIFGRVEQAKTGVGKALSATVGKTVEKSRKANSAALEIEDTWFARPHYAFALAQYCKAHGVSVENLRNGKALGNGRAYAIKEAQKATYRDTNAFSQAISELGRYHGDNVAKKAISLVSEGILPFRKTPANILVRGIEYSPIGLLNGIKKAVWDVQREKATAAEAIDSISAGLTGTGLLGLGIWLAAEGLIRGAGGGDEEEKEFEELQGHQTYALELPNGTSITLDWLAPEVLPLFIGVNLYEMASENKGESSLSDILMAVSNVTEPLLEMSCLQSLNDVFDSVGYAASGDLDALPSALISAATSYLTQAFPTILGQAERSSQGERMTTYTEKDNFLTPDLQYTLGKISAKIPGWDFQQIPYVDAWGRTESTGTVAGNMANNFLNPAYMSQIETSEMEAELQRLYEATGESVFPSRPNKYITVGGEKKHLTGEEYVKYATEQGQLSYDVLTDLTSRPEYAGMSDAEKVEAVDFALDYAEALAKTTVSDYKPDGWIASAIESGMDEVDYLLYKMALSMTDKQNTGGSVGSIDNVEKANAILSRGNLSNGEIAALWDTEKGYEAYAAGVDMRAYVEHVSNGGNVKLDKLIDAQSKNIGTSTYFTFNDMVKKYDKPNASGNLGTYTNDEVKAAIDATPGLTKSQKHYLWVSMGKNEKTSPYK